jgi:thiol:disulfide interchange protein DsbD
MAFPYILFSSSSRLMKLIPKPGRWMENFKYFMGFLLFGFAVYLMIGLPKDMVLPTIGMCTVLAFSVILYTRYAPFGSSLKKKITAGIITLVLIGMGIKFNFSVFYNFISEDSNLKSKENSVVWEIFSPKKLIDAHEEGRHVIIDFTANWCMNCQYNKIRVYHSKEVTELIRNKNILPLKADLTKNNPEAESLMHHLGSRSVPFFSVFPGDDPYSPVIFRDIVRKKNIIRVLSNLKEK